MNGTIFDFDKKLKFDHSLKKIDILEILPTTSSAEALNKTGALLFQIQQTSNPIDICNSYMYFKIKLEGISDTSDNITLEHNWFLHLFSQISIKLGATEIESIETPGEASELLNFVMTDRDYRNQYLNTWIPDTSKGDTTNEGFKIRKELYGTSFEGMYPLKTLFGFFQNYHRLIYLIPVELRMTRNINYKNIFYGTNTGGEPKLVFEELKLMVPSITCNNALEGDILKRMNSSKPIDVNFLERISTSIDIPEGTQYSWTPTILKSRPRYILVGFKDQSPEFTENYSKFIQNVGSNEIRSIRVKLNNTHYPIDPLTFSYKNNQQLKPYKNYQEMCNLFGVDPQINMIDFKNLYSIFCFDVSAQDEKLAINGVTITIDINKDIGFKARCFAVILTEKEVKIELSTGKMATIS